MHMEAVLWGPMYHLQRHFFPRSQIYERRDSLVFVHYQADKLSFTDLSSPFTEAKEQEVRPPFVALVLDSVISKYHLVDSLLA